MRSFIPTIDGGYYRDWSEEEIAAHEAEQAEGTRVEKLQENREVSQDLLNRTDWTQIPNSGLTQECVTAFAVYRSALRAIRQNVSEDSVFPIKPQEVWDGA